MEVDIERLNELILNKGMSYLEFARKCGMSKQHISRVVNGKVGKTRIKTIKKFADVLEVKPRELVKGGKTNGRS